MQPVLLNARDVAAIRVAWQLLESLACYVVLPRDNRPRRLKLRVVDAACAFANCKYLSIVLDLLGLTRYNIRSLGASRRRAKAPLVKGHAGGKGRRVGRFFFGAIMQAPKKEEKLMGKVSKAKEGKK